MIASAVGMAAGGFLVSANPRTERTVMVALILAGLTLVVLALGLVPAALAAPVVGLAGFCSGVAAPSRDMLIRRVTPKGATGSVYGLVYSGMDVGSALGPLAFGLLLDAGLRQGPGGRGRGFRRRGAAGPVDRGAGAPRRSGGGRARAVLSASFTAICLADRRGPERWHNGRDAPAGRPTGLSIRLPLRSAPHLARASAHSPFAFACLRLVNAARGWRATGLQA